MNNNNLKVTPPENMETLLKQNDKTYTTKTKSYKCSTVIIVIGVINLTAGIYSMCFDYFDAIMQERTKMRPGLPPLEYWREPTVPLLLSVTFFNVTNSVSYLKGIDNKLVLEEVGPIVYHLRQNHVNITHYDNDTISYFIERNIEFLEEANEPGILNKTIITPNALLLSFASYIHSSGLYVKFLFNMFATRDDVFLKRTVYELLWNYTTPSLNTIKRIFPFLVPRDNGGILYNVMYPQPTNFNVKIGPNRGYNKFFTYHTFNGKPKIPGFENEDRETCPIWLDDCRDGANLPPFITKDNVLKLWRDKLCQTFSLIFEKEEKCDNFDAYRFTLSNDTYVRLEDPEMDCMKQSGAFMLPNGVNDMSKCAFDLPASASNPHFYGFDGEWNNYIQGMSPDHNKHSTYLILEPTTGVPLEAVARIQSNVPIPPLTGFSSDINRMSAKIIPLFWVEYKIGKLLPEILLMTSITVAVPVLQIICIIVFLLVGIIFTFIGIKKLHLIPNHFFKDKLKIVETDTFLHK